MSNSDQEIIEAMARAVDIPLGPLEVEMQMGAALAVARPLITRQAEERIMREQIAWATEMYGAGSFTVANIYRFAKSKGISLGDEG